MFFTQFSKAGTVLVKSYTTLALVLAAATTAQALPVKNFSHVGESEILLRGAQPLTTASKLKGLGVETVIIFKTDTRGEVETEIQNLLASGLEGSSIHHIPMAWKNIDFNESCKQTMTALEIIEESVAQGKVTYFHCSAGEDRTGLLAGLYRLVSEENQSAEGLFQEELCAKGYADGNPGKPSHVTRQIQAGLTPLFFALAEKISAAKASGREIGIGLCRGLKPIRAEVTCSNPQ